MAIDFHQCIAGADIPNDGLIVGASSQQDVESGWMPAYETDTTLMVEQIDNGFGEGARQATIGDLPNLKRNENVIK